MLVELIVSLIVSLSLPHSFPSLTRQPFHLFGLSLFFSLRPQENGEPELDWRPTVERPLRSAITSLGGLLLSLVLDRSTLQASRDTRRLSQLQLGSSSSDHNSVKCRFLLRSAFVSQFSKGPFEACSSPGARARPLRFGWLAPFPGQKVPGTKNDQLPKGPRSQSIVALH